MNVKTAMLRQTSHLEPGAPGTDENPIMKDGLPHVYSSAGKLVRRLDFDPETMEIIILSPGEGLSEEQKVMLENAVKMPIVYDEDCPKSSPERLERMKQYGLARNKRRREESLATQ